MTLSNDIAAPVATPGQTWGIQDFAALFETTTRTLRFYEDKGLLSPARQAGARVFGPDDKLRMEHISRAKRLGFSLEDIKAVQDVTDGLVTDLDDLTERRDSFKKVIGSLRRRRKDIDILTKELARLCRFIDDFIETAPDQTGVFKYAQAYDAALREHMDDEFGFDDTPNISASVPNKHIK